MFKSFAFLLLALPLSAAAQTTPPSARHPASLDDLYSEMSIVDTAIAPSGRHMAVIVRRADDDVLMVMDLQTRERKVIERVGFTDAGRATDMHLTTVYWKSDDRVLYRISILPAENARVEGMSDAKISKLGNRLFVINRDGTKRVPLLGDNHNAALEGAFDLGAIASFLPSDPEHLLMSLDGFNGRSLFKVNIETGKGEQVERPSESVVGWWLDLEGNPVVRITESNGTIRLFRKDVEKKWRKFYTMRARDMKERPEYELVGASDQPGKHYVLARAPGHDHTGLYLYDLEKEQFGEPLLENPNYDITYAKISRDGKRVQLHCYLAHVRVCEFADAKIDGHMKGVRKFFEESANVYVFDSSENGQAILLYVEGPRDPPAYYYYLTEKRSIEPVGTVQRALSSAVLPTTTVVSYQTRDGKALTGYLTSPANLPAGTKAPLVIMPHGGPEARDHLTFDPWVQFLVARGYAVFQPNFRGSDGFGKTFAESGYREWGRKMQDDLGDGLKALVERGSVDAAHVCIVGASYGGYAALAGASLTPDLYQCAVSIAGVSDLNEFSDWRKRKWGADSPGFAYSLKSIGDPQTDEARLREVSPVDQAAKIKIPVLLVHGTEDEVVPIAQSTAMKRALDKAGHKTELIKLDHEGHSYWSRDNEKLVLNAVDKFLWQHLGPGAGVTTPPAPGAKDQ